MKSKMKIFAVILSLIFFIAAPVFCEERGPAEPDTTKPPSIGLKKVEAMKFPPLKVTIPKVGKEVERVVLPNGMILYLYEDHRFPEITIMGMIRTGESYETKERSGVAGITGTVMRTGGTRDYTPDQLNDELDFMAATLETSIGEESGTIYLDVISSQIDPALKLFEQVLRYPAFNGKQIDLAKSQIKESLIRRNEQPSHIGDLEFYDRLYPDYCRGWEPEWTFIKTIDKKDLQAWHERFYHPNNMMFAISGDFNKEEMIARFNKLFGDWKPTPVDFSGLQDVKFEFQPGIFLAKKEVDQSYIRMGHLGVKRTNPDRYAIQVMNYILGGGGFRSYLGEKVRSDEGLAYSVGSYFNLTSRIFGSTGAYSSTRADATEKAISLMLSTIEKIRTQMVGAPRLKEAKDSIINAFLFEFNNPMSRAGKLMSLEYDGLPADFYEKYCDNIKKVTQEDVLRVAKEHLHPDKMTIIVVGNPDKFDKPLSTLGKVTDIILKEFKE